MSTPKKRKAVTSRRQAALNEAVREWLAEAARSIAIGIRARATRRTAR
jgi:hypothetical protein